MEKHLAWVVGSVGTLLLGVMTPVMAFASPTLQTVATSSGHSGGPVSALSEGSVLPVSSSMNRFSPSLPIPQGTRLKYKIQSVDHVAAQAVGGGNITGISIDPSNSEVWIVTVHRATDKFQVHISLATYTVIDIQRM